MSESAASPARSAPDLLSLVQTRRVLVTLGSGGVGKTTTAAALGLLAARRARRTLVMTIDPARRLASSLGCSASTTSSARCRPSCWRRSGWPRVTSTR